MVVIKSSRKKHTPVSPSTSIAGALRDVSQVFDHADVRKEERFRRGILPSVRDEFTFIEHGPLRVLLSATPTESTLSSYVATLRSYNVSHVVRVCEPHYNPSTLTALSPDVDHHDWPFADGETPPCPVISNWLSLLDDQFDLFKHSKRFPSSAAISVAQDTSSSSDQMTLTMDCGDSTSTSPNSSADGLLSTPVSKPRTVAIHCAAGLGRAPALVALALVELGLSPHEAVGWMRAVRRGAINAKQFAFLQEYQRRETDCQQQQAQASKAGRRGRRISNSAGSSGNGAKKDSVSKRSKSPFSFLASWRRSLSPSGKASPSQQQQQQRRCSDGGGGPGYNVSFKPDRPLNSSSSIEQSFLGLPSPSAANVNNGGNGFWSSSSSSSLSTPASPNGGVGCVTRRCVTTANSPASAAIPPLSVAAGGGGATRGLSAYQLPKSAFAQPQQPNASNANGNKNTTTFQYNFYHPAPQVVVVQQPIIVQSQPPQQSAQSGCNNNNNKAAGNTNANAIAPAPSHGNNSMVPFYQYQYYQTHPQQYTYSQHGHAHGHAPAQHYAAQAQTTGNATATATAMGNPSNNMASPRAVTPSASYKTLKALRRAQVTSSRSRSIC